MADKASYRHGDGPCSTRLRPLCTHRVVAIGHETLRLPRLGSHLWIGGGSDWDLQSARGNVFQRITTCPCLHHYWPLHYNGSIVRTAGARPRQCADALAIGRRVATALLPRPSESIHLTGLPLTGRLPSGAGTAL